MTAPTLPYSHGVIGSCLLFWDEGESAVHRDGIGLMHRVGLGSRRDAEAPLCLPKGPCSSRRVGLSIP